MRGNIDYHFKCVNYQDCELELSMKADHSIFNKVFEAAKSKMEKLKNIKVNGDINVIEKFEVPDTYLSYINTVLHRKVLGIEREVLFDGIKVVSNKPVKAFFERKDNNWFITIKYQGEWVKK